jgi:hypothetical protein
MIDGDYLFGEAALAHDFLAADFRSEVIEINLKHSVHSLLRI